MNLFGLNSTVNPIEEVKEMPRKNDSDMVLYSGSSNGSETVNYLTGSLSSSSPLSFDDKGNNSIIPINSNQEDDLPWGVYFAIGAVVGMVAIAFGFSLYFLSRKLNTHTYTLANKRTSDSNEGPSDSEKFDNEEVGTTSNRNAFLSK